MRILLSFLWRAFGYILEKVKMLFTSLGLSIFEKTVPSVMSTTYSLGQYSRNQAQFNMDLPAGE